MIKRKLKSLKMLSVNQEGEIIDSDDNIPEATTNAIAIMAGIILAKIIIYYLN
jgi:hypothetical protein